MHSQEILSIAHSVFEFFCITLYTDYYTDLHKNFKVAYPYGTGLGYQIWTFL